MPGYPHSAAVVSTVTNSPFSKLAHRIAALEGERYPLHVGDSWLEPAAGAHMADLSEQAHPGMHRYARPQGHPALLEALAARHGVDQARILVTAGATGGLGALARSLVDPGDEVMILAPYWPLIRGIVTSAHGSVVEAPFYDRREKGVRACIEPLITPRTSAIYLNSPNNPRGDVLTRDELATIAALAREHDLWIWSDEIYELYAYARPHIPMRSLAPERTFTACSFSKAYAMAGNRCGYLIGPADPSVMLDVRKISMHAYFSAPTAAQLAAVRVLEHGERWLADARESYRSAGNAAADALGVPHPEGGTFLFIDVGDALDERGLPGIMSDCLDRNLILAPGSSCGAVYTHHLRLCFTSAPPAVVARGVDRLATMLAERRR